MKDYSFQQLQKKGKVTLALGEILYMKNMAMKMHFDELAEKLRIEERKILSKK